MEYKNVKSVCIVGAGVAGLATARALTYVGATCTVYDRNARLGGVWTDGYVDYGVQVPKALYEFPDFPLDKDLAEFTPGGDIQRYLEEYVDHFDLRGCITFNTRVSEIARREGGGWDVTVVSGRETRRESYDLVVICVGLYSNIPHLPDLPGQSGFRGQIHHISALKSPELLAGRKVAVVGFGKSATDAALLARQYGASSHMIVRTLHWPVPRRLAGVLPFKWGLLNRLTLTLVPKYKSPTAVENLVHRWGAPLVWLYWRVVEVLLCVQCKLWSRFGTRPSLVPDEPVEIGAFNEATMVPRPALFNAIRRGDIGFHRGSIKSFQADGVVLDDGRVLPVDCVVFGTGWRSDYSYLSETLQSDLGFAEDGVYLYRQILHPDAPGLAFVGYASTVSNILAYSMQATWLAALVAGRHVVPDREVQLREIDRLKTWKRSWIPFSHARAARLIVHLQHYLDELMMDIGVNPLRKRGIWAPLAEVFAPYQASDYRGVTPDGRDEA